MSARLPAPRSGYYTIRRPTRVRIFPLCYAVQLEDGSVSAGLVFGLSRRATRMRAVRLVNRAGFCAHQIQLGHPR